MTFPLLRVQNHLLVAGSIDDLSLTYIVLLLLSQFFIIVILLLYSFSYHLC
jgi:hypothetical protein